jgi:AraC-like DNA-binding protein
MAVWDVAGQPAGEQFAYWREVICQAFVPLTPRRTVDVTGFPAQVETRPLGVVNRAEIHSQPHLTEHGPRDVSRSQSGFYFVNLQLEGRCLARQGAVESLIAPGQFTVLDTTEPYYLDFDAEWRMLSYRIPHAEISSRLPDPSRGTGVGIDGSTGTGGVVTALMRSLWTVDESAGTAALQELAQSFAAVVSVAMCSTATRDEPSLRDGTRIAVLRYVAANLGDPGLCVASVCRRFAISPRLLHTLFEKGDRTFAATVRAMRLQRCAGLLADPSHRASITEIGARHGFADPASFSRAFRREFGVSPREARAAALGRNYGAPPSQVADGS